MRSEENRIWDMKRYERDIYADNYMSIAGIDEVGRGTLAGPVVAAAVILPNDAVIYGVNDSKKLTPGKREILFHEIKKKRLLSGLG